MSGLFQLAAVALSGSLVAGCATMSVSSHVQRGLDVSRYRTFDWGPADEIPTGDPRLDRDPFFQDHFQGAVEKALAAKGFERSESGTPDLLVHYHANISQRIDVNRIDRAFGYCYTDECPTGAIEYEAGTLVLDIVDARTNQVIWRGWAQASVEDVLDDDDRMERHINQAVSRMLERFPSLSDGRPTARTN